MKKYLFFITLLSVFGNSQIVRKYSNEFLNIGAGARGLAMGGAVISNQNDVYAPMWNPAGLTEVERDWQGAAMHAEYFESIAKYDYISFAKALDSKNGVLGISIVRLGIDNILNTTQMIDSEGNIDYDKITKFSTSDYAGIISYAFHPGGKQKFNGRCRPRQAKTKHSSQQETTAEDAGAYLTCHGAVVHHVFKPYFKICQLPIWK